MEIDEGRLVAGLRAGEDSAYEQLVRQFGGRLLGVARRILRDEEDARDAVQTAYISAFRAMGRFQGDCQLGTWLHRIVVNAALMKLRSRRRRPEEAIEALLPTYQADGHHVEQFRDGELPVDELLDQAATRKVVRACIDRLPVRYRTILLLRDFEEIPTGDVAEMMGVTPNAVKIRLHRARQALATLLRAELSSAGRLKPARAELKPARATRNTSRRAGIQAL